MARPAIQSPALSVATILVELAESWEKHNPRNDAKAWSWFRFQNDFFDDPDVFDLPGCQKLLLIYLFTRRNKGAKPIFPVKIKHAARCSSCTENEIREGLAALVALGKIIVHDHVRERTDPNVDVRERTDPVPTDVRTIRYETDETLPTGESQSEADWRPRFPGFSPGLLLRIWNEHRGTLPSVTKLNASRAKKIRARWAEEPTEDYWVACVKKMAASRFCCEGGWASFDWLVKNDSNHTKVAAGNYDNRDNGSREMTDEERADDLRRWAAEQGLTT